MPRYSTDIDIPNLDAMSPGELEAYAKKAHAQAEGAGGGPKEDWLNLSAQYARYKAKAMKFRLKGDISKAWRYESACEEIYRQIPKRMKW